VRLIEETTVTCPYCGEPITVLLDWSAGTQSYVEDCQVCCRPIEFRLHTDIDGAPEAIETRRDDD
jgi:hypothetical protein